MRITILSCTFKHGNGRRYVVDKVTKGGKLIIADSFINYIEAEIRELKFRLVTLDYDDKAKVRILNVLP